MRAVSVCVSSFVWDLKATLLRKREKFPWTSSPKLTSSYYTTSNVLSQRIAVVTHFPSQERSFPEKKKKRVCSTTRDHEHHLIRPSLLRLLIRPFLTAFPQKGGMEC